MIPLNSLLLNSSQVQTWLLFYAICAIRIFSLQQMAVLRNEFKKPAGISEEVDVVVIINKNRIY